MGILNTITTGANSIWNTVTGGVNTAISYVAPTARAVVQPVIQPIEQRIIQPAVQTVQQRVVQPAQTQFIQPTTQAAQQWFIQPAQQVIQTRVIQPAQQIVQRPEFLPTTSFMMDRIVPGSGQIIRPPITVVNLNPDISNTALRAGLLATGIWNVKIKTDTMENVRNYVSGGYVPGVGYVGEEKYKSTPEIGSWVLPVPKRDTILITKGITDLGSTEGARSPFVGRFFGDGKIWVAGEARENVPGVIWHETQHGQGINLDFDYSHGQIGLKAVPATLLNAGAYGFGGIPIGLSNALKDISQIKLFAASAACPRSGCEDISYESVLAAERVTPTPSPTGSSILKFKPAPTPTATTPTSSQTFAEIIGGSGIGIPSTKQTVSPPTVPQQNVVLPVKAGKESFWGSIPLLGGLFKKSDIVSPATQNRALFPGFNATSNAINQSLIEGHQTSVQWYNDNVTAFNKIAQGGPYTQEQANYLNTTFAQPLEEWRQALIENEKKVSGLTVVPTAGIPELGITGIPVTKVSGTGLADDYSRAAATTYAKTGAGMMARVTRAGTGTNAQNLLYLAQKASPFVLESTYLAAKIPFVGNAAPLERYNVLEFSDATKMYGKITGKPQEQVVSEFMAFRTKGGVPVIVQPEFAQRVNPSLVKVGSAPTEGAVKRFGRYALTEPLLKPGDVAGAVMTGYLTGAALTSALPAGAAWMSSWQKPVLKTVGPGLVKVATTKLPYAGSAGWAALGGTMAFGVTASTLSQPKGTRAEYLGAMTTTDIIPGAVGFVGGYNPQVFTAAGNKIRSVEIGDTLGRAYDYTRGGYYERVGVSRLNRPTPGSGMGEMMGEPLYERTPMTPTERANLESTGALRTVTARARAFPDTLTESYARMFGKIEPARTSIQPGTGAKTYKIPVKMDYDPFSGKFKPASDQGIGRLDRIFRVDYSPMVKPETPFTPRPVDIPAAIQAEWEQWMITRDTPANIFTPRVRTERIGAGGFKPGEPVVRRGPGEIVSGYRDLVGGEKVTSLEGIERRVDFFNKHPLSSKETIKPGKLSYPAREPSVGQIRYRSTAEAVSKSAEGVIERMRIQGEMEAISHNLELAEARTRLGEFAPATKMRPGGGPPEIKQSIWQEVLNEQLGLARESFGYRAIDIGKIPSKYDLVIQGREPIFYERVRVLPVEGEGSFPSRNLLRWEPVERIVKSATPEQITARLQSYAKYSVYRETPERGITRPFSAEFQRIVGGKLYTKIGAESVPPITPLSRTFAPGSIGEPSPILEWARPLPSRAGSDAALSRSIAEFNAHMAERGVSKVVTADTLPKTVSRTPLYGIDLRELGGPRLTTRAPKFVEEDIYGGAVISGPLALNTISLASQSQLGDSLSNIAKREREYYGSAFSVSSTLANVQTRVPELGISTRPIIAVGEIPALTQVPLQIPTSVQIPRLDQRPALDQIPRLDQLPEITQVPRITQVPITTPAPIVYQIQELLMPPPTTIYPPPIEIPPPIIPPTLIVPPVPPPLGLPGGGGGGAAGGLGRSGWEFLEQFALGSFVSDAFGVGDLNLGKRSKKKRKRR